MSEINGQPRCDEYAWKGGSQIRCIRKAGHRGKHEGPGQERWDA